MIAAQLETIIKQRRTHYAFDFTEQPVAETLVHQVVSSGLWAPTHKMTQPWKFVLLEGAHAAELGSYMAEYYRKIYSEEEYPTERYEETKTYPLKGTLIAIIMEPGKRAQLPEWEEVAAVSCAVQNMWLTTTVLGLGGYWDTGAATLAYLKEALSLSENEKCLGLFYLGHLKEELPTVNRKRKPLSKKLSRHKR